MWLSLAVPYLRSAGVFMSMRRLAIAALLVFAPPAVLAAQSAAEHIAAGDREYTALNAAEALGHYRKAIDADTTNAEAYWKASRSAADLGETEPMEKLKEAYFADATRFAERAVRLAPSEAEPHFAP